MSLTADNRSRSKPALPQTSLHINQISRQRQPKQHRENGHHIHNKSRRLKLSFFQQRPRFSIARQPSHNHHHSRDNRNHSHPHRKSRRPGRYSLKSRQLSQSDRKPPNREPNHKNRHARPHHSQN